MTAAGEPVERDWVQLDEFQTWLDSATRSVESADRDVPGTVLVWHEGGELAHAAVTIGGGYALHQPSQSWSSPVMVWTVEEVVRSWRFPGTRLSRHRIR